MMKCKADHRKTKNFFCLPRLLLLLFDPASVSMLPWATHSFRLSNKSVEASHKNEFTRLEIALLSTYVMFVHRRIVKMCVYMRFCHGDTTNGETIS